MQTTDAPPDHDVRAVLAITPFRRLWLALAGSSLGDWLGLLATAALAGQLASGSYTRENFAIAGVFLLRLAPAVLLGPLAGALADRLDRRWTLVLGDLLRFALFASIPLVGSLTWLYVATVLVECAALFWMPAKDATVPNLVPRQRLEAANQVSLAATYGTAPVAALLYAGLALLTGVANNWSSSLTFSPITIALWVNALTFLVSGLVILRLDIPARTVGAHTAETSVLRSILDGWRFVGSTPLVRGLVIGMLGAFAAAGFVIGLAQTYVSDLGAGQPGFGILFGAVFVGLAAGMWLGPRMLLELSRRRLFGVAIVIAGCFLIGLALVPNIVMATLFTVAVGAGGGIAWVTGYTLLGLEVEDDVRGRTFSFLQSSARVVLVLVLALGPALAAPIGAHTLRFSASFALTYNGAAWVFLLAGVLAVVMGVFSYRQMDDRRGQSLAADVVRAWRVSRASLHPAPPDHPGTFVAIEGGDGAGKSTQVRLTAQWLREELGHEVVTTREPGGTPVGDRLRAILLGADEHVAPGAGDEAPVEVGERAEALLFAADRAHHVATVVRPGLAAGRVVITDRYMDSSIAYQGAGRDLEPVDVTRLSVWATAGLVPDLTVLLDLPAADALSRRRADDQRAGEDRMEAEAEDFHERVRQSFLELARRAPRRYLVLDARLPVADQQRLIRARLREIVPVSASRRAELTARLRAEARRREDALRQAQQGTAAQDGPAQDGPAAQNGDRDISTASAPQLGPAGHRAPGVDRAVGRPGPTRAPSDAAPPARPAADRSRPVATGPVQVQPEPATQPLPVGRGAGAPAGWGRGDVDPDDPQLPARDHLLSFTRADGRDDTLADEIFGEAGGTGRSGRWPAPESGS